MSGEHSERAGETALAIDCFKRAAREAQKRFARMAGTAWLRRALTLLGEAEPVRRCALLHRICDMADSVGDRSAQDLALQQTAAVLERHPDDARQARLWFFMALLADRRADTAASERLWRQSAELAERCGAAEWAAMARGNLAYLHFARLDWYRLSLEITRTNGDRTHEVASLQRLGVLHQERGDSSTALPWHIEAQALYASLEDAIGEGVAAASMALCQTCLGDTALARSMVELLLDRLDSELAGRAAHETIELRWTCQQVLDALGDARAATLLAPLVADVQARATELTDAANRERLIRALPVFQGIVAAH